MMATKTEHAGAKNGGGYWGKRAEAKRRCRRLRRKEDRKSIRRRMGESGGGHAEDREYNTYPLCS